MKKHSKIFVALLAVALLLCLATLTLAACSKHEHLYSYNYDDEYHWQVCWDCGETTEKEAHVVEEWTTTKDATYDEEGEAKGDCTVCGKTLKKKLTKLPLSPTDQESEKLFELKHHDLSGNNPEHYSIRSYKGTATEVVIPSTYKDVPITEINFDSSWDNVKSLAVEDDNPTFQSYMGVLYEKGDIPSFYYVPKALEGEIKILDGLGPIPYYAFYGCTGITSVIIPDSVTSIGYDAFSGCTGLQSVTIGENVQSIDDKAFPGCIGLQTVNWNATNCTEAGSSRDPIFEGCTGLTTINIGENVQSIPSYAFDGCKGITRVNYLGTLKGWCEIEFSNNYANPLYAANNAKLYLNEVLVTEVKDLDGLTQIPAFAFYGLTDITSVTFPDSVTIIGNQAFLGCTNITSVKIPDSVTSIGDCAFEDCTGLQTVTIGEGVTSIGRDAFYGCTNITTATIPGFAISLIPKDSLTTVAITSRDISDYAFRDCTSLQTVTIGEGVQSIGDYAFYGCTGLQTVTIGNGVQSIGELAFRGCEGLSEITIPDNVTSIGREAFYNCTGLQTVSIGEGVTSIDEYAFSGCTGLQTVNWNATNCTSGGFGGCIKLTTVNIGENVQSIPNYAFQGCKGLASITIPDSVHSIGDRTFYGCTGITKVNYLGTLKGWCEIEFGNSYANPLYEANHNKAGTAKLYINEEEVTGDVNIPSGTSKIGSYAFYGLTGITSVIIPESVTSIGNYAFYGCDKLASITIPENLREIERNPFQNFETSNYYKNLPNGAIYLGKVFYKYKGDAPSVTDIVIKDGTTQIYKDAFKECKWLTSITLPESLTFIDCAFYGCTGITKVNYLGTLKSWCEIDFGHNSVDSYGRYDGCNPLIYCGNLYIKDEEVTEITNLDGITKIPAKTFIGLKNLKNVIIPNSVKSIGYGAFSSCDIQELIVNENVTEISRLAFSDCKIQTVKWDMQTYNITGRPNSYDSYNGVDIFYGCSINNFIIGEKVSDFGGTFTSTEVENMYFSRGLKEWCEESLGVVMQWALNLSQFENFNLYVKENDDYVKVSGNVTIPSGTSEIGNYAFQGCTNITSVKIPDSVTSIGDCAFEDCTGLTSITIPDSVQSIGNVAFSGCTGLQTVTIGEGVTSIGRYAFSDCRGLTSITIPESVTHIYDNAFYKCTGLKTVNWNATNCTYAAGRLNPIFNGCTGLTTVNIGENVQSIPAYALYGCTGLKDIYYAGNETQWGVIKKGENWDKYWYSGYHTINYQLHYNSTSPASASNIATLPSEQTVLIACDKLDLWAKQN